MQSIFTTDDARVAGVTKKALEYGTARRRWQRAARGAYVDGDAAPTPLDIALASALAADGVNSGLVAGTMLGLDAMSVIAPDFTVASTRSGRRAGARRRDLDPARIVTVRGVPCTDGLQTMLDPATLVDDLVWEQALESALRKGLTTIDTLGDAVGELGRTRTPGAGRMRRVLALRPKGAPPTESLLETLMVQLIRTAPGVPEPQRQVEVFDKQGRLVARLDLAWPELGAFNELDGQQHKDQPVYDASRETAVVTATGWLCGRFCWRQVVHHPKSTARSVASFIASARGRPLRA